MNELLLVLSVPVIYCGVLIALKLFGKSGLYCFTVIATILANIEVAIVINAFSLEQTLGNVLFASTFLVTDILSEVYGEKAAKKAVYIGIFTAVFFIIISQLWTLYVPINNDISISVKTLFSNTPRILLGSLSVYAIAQRLDVYLYHKWWKYTNKFGDTKKFLWVRNNGSTLISQLLNTLLFTLFAFYGVLPNDTLINIFISSYIIFIITSILDTPFVYLARLIAKKDIATE